MSESKTHDQKVRITTEPTPEDAWLYTRGSHSVRVSRMTSADGRPQLLVYGPGHEQARFRFGDAPECMRRQAEVERLLVALGYQRAVAVHS